MSPNIATLATGTRLSKLPGKHCRRFFLVTKSLLEFHKELLKTISPAGDDRLAFLIIDHTAGFYR